MSENTYVSTAAGNGRRRNGAFGNGADERPERTYSGPVRHARRARKDAKAGQSDRQWRLGVKILDAFTYAYSVGDREIAADLRAVLTRLEDRPQAARPIAHLPLTEQADRWTAFVAARNAYSALLERSRASEVERAAAFQRMKARYLRWSES